MKTVLLIIFISNATSVFSDVKSMFEKDISEQTAQYSLEKYIPIDREFSASPFWLSLNKIEPSMYISAYTAHFNNSEKSFRVWIGGYGIESSNMYIYPFKIMPDKKIKYHFIPYHSKTGQNEGEAWQISIDFEI